MDSGEMWDQLVASAQAKTNSHSSRPKPCGLVRLTLSQEPMVTALPGMRRSIDEIDAGVQRVLRSVVCGESPWPLFLQGPAGCGKTCAALCLLDYAGGLYYTVPQLCADLIASQQGKLEFGDWEPRKLWLPEFWLRIAKQKLVVLDEMGARGTVTDHHYEAVERMLDERWRLPLVCVSNLGADAVAKLYDDRVLSRLLCGTVVALEGKDRRLES